MKFSCLFANENNNNNESDDFDYDYRDGGDEVGKDGDVEVGKDAEDRRLMERWWRQGWWGDKDGQSDENGKSGKRDKSGKSEKSEKRDKSGKSDKSDEKVDYVEDDENKSTVVAMMAEATKVNAN